MPELYTRESPLAIVRVVRRGHVLHLPFVSDLCDGCGVRMDLSATDTFSPTRVGGNSNNGYEPWCNACDTQVRIEMDAAVAALRAGGLITQ